MGKSVCGLKTVRAGRLPPLARNHAPVQVYARAYYRCFAGNYAAERRFNARNPFAVSQYIYRFALQYFKVFGVFERFFHKAVVQVFIFLTAQTSHRRAFAAVKYSYLQQRLVRVYAHLSAERVDFAHYLSFRRAADGRIARHKGYAVEIERQHNRFNSRPCERERGFATRVPRAYHYGVVISFRKFVHFF